MKNLNAKLGGLALLLSAFGAIHATAQTSPFLTGDIVVTLYGDAGTSETTSGGNPINYADGNATPISLEEFAPTIGAGIDNGTPLLKVSLPTTGTGNNVGIVGEYGSSSEGTIQVSGNGQYLTIGGYDGNLDERGAPSGGYSVSSGTAEAQSTDSNVPRVAAVINIATGSVDTSTVLDDIYDGNNPRAVYSPDGSTLLLSGQGISSSDQGGLYKTTTGTNTTTTGHAPTGIDNLSSTRTVTQFNLNASQGTTSTANTYYSMDQDSRGIVTAGIFEYSGTPGSGQSSMGTQITPSTVTVKGKSYNLSPEGFFFANATTLYVADTGAPKNQTTGNALGGIQKWSFSAANQTWSLDYTMQFNFSSSSSETGFSSLAGQVVNGVVDLYATSYTTNDDDPDGLYAVADTLSDTTAATSSIVELAASTNDNDFKGVAFIPEAVPEPSTYALLFASLGFLGFLARRKLAANG